MIVLRTLGARERRRMIGGRRRVKAVEDSGEPDPVPTVRASLIRAEPLGGPDEAEKWLETIRRDETVREDAVTAALLELNAVIRAHRAAAGDPYAREVARWQANAVRAGYGSGDEVAEGRFGQAHDVPEPRGRVRRAVTLSPQERLAAVLGGNDRVLVTEELTLRAQLDVDGGRPREAALQARVALEALLAELPAARGDIEPHREAVGHAANAALLGDPPAELQAAVVAAVTAMRRALAHRNP